MKKVLSDLKNKFSSIESTSIKHSAGKNQFLAIRLDGVRFTHKYSRKEFIPFKMNSMVTESVFETYQSIFNKHDQDKKNMVLCIIQVNDEVTFVFNRGNNKYERRILKILSIVNGLMSSWSTNYILKNQNDKLLGTQVEYYDARPIILSSHPDICEYIKYRYLTAKKHALAKTLKFNNIAITPKTWENISASKKLVAENKLHSEFEKIEETFKLYVPDDNYNLKSYGLTEKIISESLENILKHSCQQQCKLDSNVPQIKTKIIKFNESECA